MWRNRYNLQKPSKKWRMKGEPTFLFKGKIFFHSSILFFSYHSYGGIIPHLLLYIIFMNVFVVAWKCKKWWAASLTTKGRKAATNNQQSEVLNINSNLRTPNDNAKSSLSTSPQHILLLSLYCCRG